MALLEIDGMSVVYGRQQAVTGVSINVGDGEAVGIVGVNGAGKSTTLNAVFGLARKRSGSVQFDGRNISAKTPEEISSTGLGYVPEGRHIFSTLSVRENMKLARCPRGEFQSNLEEMLDQFPILGERIDEPAWTLSGGEQQQLAIARALISRPRLLILDEPSLGLAPQMVERVFAVVRRLHETGLSILLVEQNAGRCLGLVSRVYVMQKGRIVKEGTSLEMANEDSLWTSPKGGPA
ncbi:MAG: ABC transporter ATP-binding protein [Actinobacteria bacterium]|nr:ABC transporter ATP-binding protein [Actinomycetota bacterium]